VSTPALPRRRPPGRYDEPSRTEARAIAVLLSVLFVGLLAAVAFTLFTRYGSDRVTVQERGFTVLSDDAVRVRFAVTAPQSETAWCLVRARRADGAEVGAVYVPVTPEAGTSGPVEATHELSTTDRAVTGEVPRCTLSEPPTGTPTARLSP